MQTAIYYLTFVASAAVLVVLVLGLLNMARSTGARGRALDTRQLERRTNLSQQLMRWRVGLQFLAIVIIMAAVYVSRGA